MGIIENHEELRELLKSRGYVFNSQTDTEVIAHLVEWECVQPQIFLKLSKKP